MKKLALVAAVSVLGAAFSNAALLFIDVTGTPSWDAYGDANNTVMNNNIGAGSHVTGIGWDVTLTAIAPSWLEELWVGFEDSGLTTGVYLAPGDGVGTPGTAAYSSGGIVDLVGLGFDFFVGGDGVLRSEFFESFDDNDNVLDGTWDQGIITVEYSPVPEPASMLALGLGAAALAARRRRKLA